MALERARTLKENYLKAGGHEASFEVYARGGLGLGDEIPQDASKEPDGVRSLAQRALAAGKLIEYACYDARGRSQGVALCRFEGWVDAGALTFRAAHLASSDGYYEWWAQKNLKGICAGYHLCEGPRRKCRVISDHSGRIGVHLTQWRLMGPRDLLSVPYAADAAVQELDAILQADLAAQVPPPPPVNSGAPVGSQAPQGSGLDAALNDPGAGDHEVDEGVDQLLKLAKQAKSGKADDAVEEPAKKKAKKTGLGEQLAKRASALNKERSRSRRPSGSGKEKKAAGSGEAAKKKKSKGILEVSSSSSGEESSVSEQGFRVASSREVDLVRLSQKDPGCLLRSALKEMSRYLSARGEAQNEDESQGKVLSYLHQVLLPQFPKAGVRSTRELTTLASAVDLLLAGDLGRAGDLIIQRFKAIEASLAAEGNWSVAQHYELIPGRATLSTKAEQTEAAKAELRARKLRQSIHRGDQHGNPK